MQPLKIATLFLLSGFVAGATNAQIQVQLKFSRLQYIAYEPLMANVTITNRAGRDIDLHDDGSQHWFEFEITGSDGQSIAADSSASSEPLHVEAGRTVWLFVFGGAWLLQALSNSYFLLFFPVLIGLWILWFGRAVPRRALALVATWVVSSVPLVPILWTYARIHGALNLVRERREVESFSADIASIFTTTPEMVVWRGLSNANYPEGQLFPGAVALLLVGAAIVLGLLQGRHTQRLPATSVRVARYVCLVLALIVAAVALSTIRIGPWQFPAERPMFSVSSPRPTRATTSDTAAPTIR